MDWFLCNGLRHERVKQYTIVLFIVFLSHKKKGKKENLRPTVKIKNRNRKITEVSESQAVFNGSNRSSLKGYITDTYHHLLHSRNNQYLFESLKK